MKIKEVQDCQFSSWYNEFKEVTFKSEIIPLQEDFIRYLLADGVILPKGCDLPQATTEDSSDTDDDHTHTDWSDDNTEDETQHPDFPDLTATIEKCIAKLGGKVFPKLNWSSPKDARWLSFNGSLKCTNATDVYLLLKGSSFCAHDLREPYNECVDYDPSAPPSSVQYSLVLRKWQEIHPSAEFRAFVKHGQIIGISQRNYSTCYDFLSSQTDDIIDDVTNFYSKHLHAKFHDKNVVFDVYRKNKNRLYLVDLNPYGDSTDPLLFTWEQLNHSHTEASHQLRPPLYLTPGGGVLQPQADSHFSVPLDFVHLSAGADASKLIDLLTLSSQNDSSEDSDTVSDNTRHYQSSNNT